MPGIEARRTSFESTGVDSQTTTPLDEIIELTGLARIIARGTVNRALETVGTDVDRARPEDYVAALPELRKRIAAFITTSDARSRLDAMERRLRRRAGLLTGPFRAVTPTENDAT